MIHITPVARDSSDVCFSIFTRFLFRRVSHPIRVLFSFSFFLSLSFSISRPFSPFLVFFLGFSMKTGEWAGNERDGQKRNHHKLLSASFSLSLSLSFLSGLNSSMRITFWSPEVDDSIRSTMHRLLETVRSTLSHVCPDGRWWMNKPVHTNASGPSIGVPRTDCVGLLRSVLPVCQHVSLAFAPTDPLSDRLLVNTWNDVPF